MREERDNEVGPNLLIESATVSDCREIAALIRAAIPNALISHLGLQFGSIYYRAIMQRDEVFTVVARDQSRHVVGVLIGVLDADFVHRQVLRSEKSRLLVAANLHIFRPAVLRWMLLGLWHKLRTVTRLESDKEIVASGPNAELLAIALIPQKQGSGLAYRLVDCFEGFVHLKGSGQREYCIRTEAANLAANKFYNRIGAVKYSVTVHHGREIVQWRKRL